MNRITIKRNPPEGNELASVLCGAFGIHFVFWDTKTCYSLPHPEPYKPKTKQWIAERRAVNAYAEKLLGERWNDL